MYMYVFFYLKNIHLLIVYLILVKYFFKDLPNLHKHIRISHQEFLLYGFFLECNTNCKFPNSSTKPSSKPFLPTYMNKHLLSIVKAKICYS